MDLGKWNPFKFRRSAPSQKQADEKKASETTSLAAARPLSPFDVMQRAMTRMMDDPFFSSPLARLEQPFPENRWFGDFSPAVFQPSIDIADEGKSIRVTAEVPGMSEKDIEVTVDSGALTISGEKRSDASKEEDGCYRTERAYGYFKRVLPLPTDVESGGVEAHVENGVLTVRVPKSQTAKPQGRKVPVSGK